MHNHERIDVWHLSTALSVTICQATARTRVRRHRWLLNQLERSISSIPANIAEGSGQPTDAKFATFLGHAIGSIAESMSHLTQAQKLGLLPGEDIPGWRAELQRIRRMTESFQRRLLFQQPDGTEFGGLESKSRVRGPRSGNSTEVPGPES